MICAEDYIARMKKKCEKLGCFLECSFEFLLGFQVAFLNISSC